MAGIELKLNRQGVHELLRDETVALTLQQMGERVAQAASGYSSASHPGRPASRFVAEVHRGGGRFTVHVYPAVNPASETAQFEDPWHHWLLAALDQARL